MWGNMDAKQFIYLPSWFKVVSVFLLSSIIIFSILLTVYFIDKQNMQDWILVTMSVTHIAASSLVVGGALMFSNREASGENIKSVNKGFLEKYIIDAHQEINIPISGGLEKVSISKFKIDAGILGGYTFSAGGKDFAHFKVQCNVKRVTVLYFLPESNVLDWEQFWSAFGDCFGRAHHVGWEVRYSIGYEEFNKSKNLIIVAMIMMDDDFLMNPAQKIFLSQDIAQMTRSFVLSGIRAKILPAVEV